VKGHHINKDIVAGIESRIEKLVRGHARALNGGIIDRGTKRKNKDEENPLDRYQSTSNVRALAVAAYKPPRAGR
jgi:hypothetical protein